MVQTGALSKSKRAAGGGQLGEGAFRGYIAREKIDREKEKSNRADDYLGIAQEDLGIRKEKQGWKREDREKEDSIQTGMVDANEKGGYEGVIDFLKTVDPERALKFDQGKKNLDASIMRNDVMKTTSKLAKNKAMVESYGVLGKMGASIMNAPEEDRNAMYQRMLPMFKKINPDASNSWDAKAQNDMQLAISQATPANQIFKAKQEQIKYQGRQGAIMGNIEALENVKDRTPAQEKSLQTFKAAAGKINEDALSASLKRQKLEAEEKYTKPLSEIQIKKEVSRVKKELDTSSNAYLKFTKETAGLDAAAEIVQEGMDKNGKVDYVSAAIVARTLAKMAAGAGTMTDRDVDDVVTSETSYKSAKKYFQALKSGDVSKFSTTEVENMLKVYGKIKDSNMSVQRSVESRYYKQYDKNGQMEDMYNQVVTPIQAYKTQRDTKKFIRNIPEKFRSGVQDRIDSGASLLEVKKQWDQYNSKQQGGSQ